MVRPCSDNAGVYSVNQSLGFDTSPALRHTRMICKPPALPDMEPRIISFRFLIACIMTGTIWGMVTPISSFARVHNSRIHRLEPHSLFHPSYRCSVFGGPPCFPYETCSSVFRRRPCLPDIVYPMGQELQLTISSSANSAPERAQENDHSELSTINQVFADLRSCWMPPSHSSSKSRPHRSTPS